MAFPLLNNLKLNTLKHFRIVLVFVLALMLLSGCGGHLYHRVEPGETLYSIGWIYGYDYREIASWNNIPPPYNLSPGLHLRVAPPSGYAPTPVQESRDDTETDKVFSPRAGQASDKPPAPVVDSLRTTAKVVDRSRDIQDKSSSDGVGQDAQEVISAAKAAVNKLFNQHDVQSNSLQWQWPVENRRVLRTFSAKDPLRQGLDFAGEKGSAVLAAAAGRVVYAGSGLVQHGRLIIVKHNEKFLSAYSHNQKLYVKEGESVKAGQRIADMGRTGHLGDNFGAKSDNRNSAKLHFEIRRNGKPVNPSIYLPK